MPPPIDKCIDCHEYVDHKRPLKRPFHSGSHSVEVSLQDRLAWHLIELLTSVKVISVVALNGRPIFHNLRYSFIIILN